MSSTSALTPLFRSEQQLRLLTVLFADAADELAIGELAERAGVSQSTASREVARLAGHGLVTIRRVGRNALVAANWRLPWASELRSILVQTVGVVGRLADALRGVSGVDGAFVFGSWAARYGGAPGPAPRDVDVLVVGTAALAAVRRALREVEADLRVEVNPVVVTPERWLEGEDDPFLDEVRTGALVPIPVHEP